MTHHFVKTVTSADGTRLAVFESGNPDGPVLVGVHGFPDNHTTWDGIAAELGDAFRVVTYDVRGAGASDKPTATAAYTIARLTEDFRAVIDEVSPDAPVHLLAHDWGSIQSWGPVTDPSFADRISSFTSISGPSFDYCGAWFRERSHLRASINQAVHSVYMGLFQIPRFPEFVMSKGFVQKGIARAEAKAYSAGAVVPHLERDVADLTNGINLYRANVFQRLRRPQPLRTTIPVQVLAPTDDPYATVQIVSEAPAPYVDDLTVVEIPGGHWVVATRPELVAMHVREFVAGLTPAPGRRARR